jgi:hypothetical protein
MADGGRRAAAGEMDTVHQCVDCRYEITICGAVEQSGVIAHANSDVGALYAAVPEITVDESEFG